MIEGWGVWGRGFCYSCVFSGGVLYRGDCMYCFMMGSERGALGFALGGVGRLRYEWGTFTNGVRDKKMYRCYVKKRMWA